MTKKELLKYLNTKRNILSLAVKKAAKECKSISDKAGYDTSFRSADYTIDECLLILSKLDKPFNKMQIELFKEHFIDNGNKPVITLQNNSIYIKGMEEFLEKKKNATFIRCCETCSYLTGKMSLAKGSRIFPFCSFYEKYLGYQNKIDIFKDWCKTYEYNKGALRIWYNSKAPSNLTSSGSIDDTVNGISRNELEGNTESMQIIKHTV